MPHRQVGTGRGGDGGEVEGIFERKYLPRHVASIPCQILPNRLAFSHEYDEYLITGNAQGFRR